MFSYRVTYVILEELQPLVVFTFSFPHFDQRLNLRKKIYLPVCSMSTWDQWNWYFRKRVILPSQ